MGTHDSGEDRLTWFDIAEITGSTVRSLRAIHYRAEKNRREALATGDDTVIKPGDLPPPDGYEPQDEGNNGRYRPYWTQTAIDDWLDRKAPRRR